MGAANYSAKANSGYVPSAPDSIDRTLPEWQ